MNKKYAWLAGAVAVSIALCMTGCDNGDKEAVAGAIDAAGEVISRGLDKLPSGSEIVDAAENGIDAITSLAQKGE